MLETLMEVLFPHPLLVYIPTFFFLWMLRIKLRDERRQPKEDISTLRQELHCKQKECETLDLKHKEAIGTVQDKDSEIDELNRKLDLKCQEVEYLNLLGFSKRFLLSLWH